MGMCGSSQAQVPDSDTADTSVATLNSLATDLNWSEQTREAADRILTSHPEATIEEILLDLLSSRDSRARRNALEAVSRGAPSPTLLLQVSVMAERDPDARCQAKARLILAEFAAMAPARLQTTNDAPSRPLITTRLPQDARPTDRRPVDRRPREPFETNRTDDSGNLVVEPILVSAAAMSILDAGSSRAKSVEMANFNEFELSGVSRGTLPPISEPKPFDAETFSGNDLEPRVLNRPLSEPDDVFAMTEPESAWPVHPLEAPLGYSGPSGIIPTDTQEDAHFVPMTDRWRSGFPKWDRYGRGHPEDEDYPFKEGHWWDPYNLNMLKGDYPIIGQHIFLRLTGRTDLIQEYRQLPTETTPFESTLNKGQSQFFGDPNQYFTTNFFRLSVELTHGNTNFKPADWTVRFTPVFDFNYLDVSSLAIVNPDVRDGPTRTDRFLALEEYFFETKLKDLSPDYDFMSLRIGSQPFVSDFRGLIFADTNRAIRLFGTRLANRDQFNVALFRQAEKDTNSQLNTMDDRNQTIFIANYYRQDFIFPGYTAQMSMHYNDDGPSFKFDHNNFLARPDPVGVFQPHRVQALYFGMTGDGHVGRVNFTNAFYWATGRDSLNPIAGAAQTINAQLAAAEVSYDRDWVRFRTSIFWTSGDRNPYDRTAGGFDTIFDNPNFAGGQFSYWQRQQFNLQGVGLVNRFSLVPDLRSSKFQGQSNFVNPGLRLLTLGADFDLTPKLRMLTNANYLEFDNTRVLKAFTFQNNIHRTIGVDLSVGFEYRPRLSDNVIWTCGYACLIPGAGLKDLFGSTKPLTTANAQSVQLDFLNSIFAQLTLQF